ncbi:MAG TPA: hypothetical protein VNT30_18995 [Stellaceae bacterium]|nr:hypothetical protein [Stellaceae bacterium]
MSYRSMSVKKLLGVAIVSCGMLFVSLSAARADDDEHGYRHDHGYHEGWHRRHEPDVIYAPGPVVLVPPPRVYYAPPPPVVYAVPSQLNIIVPLR